jgi:hypothetical protein
MELNRRQFVLAVAGTVLCGTRALAVDPPTGGAVVQLTIDVQGMH